MRLILIIFLTFSLSILSSQVIIKTKYSNIASQGFAIGISKYSGNNNFILNFYSQKRYRIINSGVDISSVFKDKSITLKNMYISLSAGLGIPIIHGKRSTTTFNINGTYNLFDFDTNIGIKGKFGYVTSLKYNMSFATLQVGYIGNPKSDNPYLNRNGLFVKLGIGLNEFFSKEKGWELKNYTSKKDKIELKKGDKVQGSGFALNKDGYIITSYHVIKDGEKINVTVSPGKDYKAKVIASDEKSDLAIIKINTTFDSIPYHFKTKESISGKKVYALGYPKSNILGTEVKITEGIINSVNGFKDNKAVYQISAPITNGNSGGPLFDEYGNVIGINSSGYRDESSDLINYATKLSEITALGKDIKGFEDIINKYNTEKVDASVIANEYGKFIFIIIVEH